MADSLLHGAGPKAIAAHYDLPAEFFALWLDEYLCYSCALWPIDRPTPSLEASQRSKSRWYGRALGLGPESRVLDVGTGWGAVARHLAEDFGCRPIGLTLSGEQARHISQVAPAVEVRLQNWQEMDGQERFDAAVNLEAMEHFARMDSNPSERALAYRNYFDLMWSVLAPSGRFGLQTFCYSGADRSRVDQSNPLADLLQQRIFPDSALPYLSELCTAWEPSFEVLMLTQDSEDYCRTLGEWYRRLVARRNEADALVGRDVTRDYLRYLAGGARLFAEGYWSLYRIILARRPTRHG